MHSKAHQTGQSPSSAIGQLKDPLDGQMVFVSPANLRSFAEMLTEETATLRGHASSLEVINHLIHDGRVLGDFPEAIELAAGYRRAVTLMDSLIAQVGDAVQFADDVAQKTSHVFDQADHEATAAINRAPGWASSPSTGASE